MNQQLPAPTRFRLARLHSLRTCRIRPAVLVAIAAVLASGCVHSTKTTRSVLLEEPRISTGVIIQSPDPNRLTELAEALDTMQIRPADSPAGSGNPAAIKIPEQTFAAERPSDLVLPGLFRLLPMAAEAPTQPTITAATAMVRDLEIPAGAVRLISLPKMSRIEVNDLVASVSLRLGAERVYGDGPDVFEDLLPTPPQGVSEKAMLIRNVDGTPHVIRIGERRFASQPPQLWVLGVIIHEDNSLAANPDLETIEPWVTEAIASMQEMRTNMAVSDLESQVIQLSYISAQGGLDMLGGMGITTVATPSEMPDVIEFDKLPYVLKMPDPATEEIGLIGEGTSVAGEFGVSLTPSLASPIASNTVASPMTQLLVMYHPARPEQFSRVRRLLDDYIDRPARQIFVEGMVLEISEDGLRDLGVEWQLDQPPVFWRFGSLGVNEGDTVDVMMDDLDLHRVFTSAFDWRWSLKLRTLIREGKAEILSRPSVLTLNNRQSTIRVGTDIPIATSQEGIGGSQNKIAFTFKYLPTGILLNIRPRINEEGTEVSMLIDTIVSAVVPGADLEIRTNDGDLLATAPTVSTRRVQTYGRILNNTPFIIGGLVSRTNATIQDKIPLLGDIPWLGAAFRAERTESSKREVIIVLTPYVLPENQPLQRSLPKDEDTFDSIGNDLFRDSYRVRTEDVFDLRFLFEHPRVKAYRDLAQEIISKNFRLAGQEPFASFDRHRTPGEAPMVTRMMYEMLKRLEIAESVPASRIIFFEGKQHGGFDVRFLESTLGRLGGGETARDFFNALPGRALAMTFYLHAERDASGQTLSEPIPELSIIECADRDTWETLLWQLNQPDSAGRKRHTILIQNFDDLVRLRRALALKRVIRLNGGAGQLLLRNYRVGQVLLIPEFKPDQIHVIDADVARYFFHTEHYYATTLQELEERLQHLDEVLRQPEISGMLDDPGAIDAAFEASNRAKPLGE